MKPISVTSGVKRFLHKWKRNRQISFTERSSWNTEARILYITPFFFPGLPALRNVTRLRQGSLHARTYTHTQTKSRLQLHTYRNLFHARHCTPKKQAHLQHINPINGQVNLLCAPPQTGCTQQSLAPRNPPWVTGMSGTKRIPFLNGVFGGRDIMQPLRHCSCHSWARDCAHYADVFGSWFFAGAPPRRIACLPSTWLHSPAGSVPWQSACLPCSVEFLTWCLFRPSSPDLTKLFFFFPGHWAERSLFSLRVKTAFQSHSLHKQLYKKVSQIFMQLCLVFAPQLSVIITKAKALLAFIRKTFWEPFGQLIGILLIV